MSTTAAPTCGHPNATYPLGGALYCARDAVREFARYQHLGHTDEPAPVPLVGPDVCPCCGQRVHEGQVH